MRGRRRTIYASPPMSALAIVAIVVAAFVAGIGLAIAAAIHAANEARRRG